MNKLSYLLILISVFVMTGCGGEKKPAAQVEQTEADTVYHAHKQRPKSIPHTFSGDLSKYYRVNMCSLTPITTMELEEMHIEEKPDYRYYTVSVGLERNGTPFDFPVDNLDCIYKIWLVPTQFPAGKFNVHAQVLDSHNTNVAQLDFAEEEELKDLLKKCPNEGDFIVIDDMLEIERMFDKTSNKLDIRGYIKPM